MTHKLSTVLVADDANVMRETLCEILGAEDYRVIGEATNGAEVVDQVKRLQPEVVALDTVMPGSTVIALLRSILDVSPTTRVVMCSSLGQDDLVAEALHEGAHGFILKPFCPARTLRTFDRVCGLVSPPLPPEPKVVEEALEAWCPPTLRPSTLGLKWLALWIIQVESHNTLRSSANRQARSWGSTSGEAPSAGSPTVVSTGRGTGPGTGCWRLGTRSVVAR